VRTGEGLRAGVYVQGGTEHAHGRTSTLLSAVAVRSGQIAAAIGASVPDRRHLAADAVRPLVASAP
jgi:L-ornithine N5-oxygenase